jgi:hypothetical protein
MERNRWETAVRCLEVAVHPDTSDEAIVAAVDAFRRNAGGVPLSQVCLEFACGGVPLAELARIKESLERLNRENLEFRRNAAVGEAAQAAAQRRLDAAYRRIHELTRALLAAQRQADAVEPELPRDRSTLLGSGSGRLQAAAPVPAVNGVNPL